VSKIFSEKSKGRSVTKCQSGEQSLRELEGVEGGEVSLMVLGFFVIVVLSSSSSSESSLIVKSKG
jgi:hypothetical protein